MAFSPGASNGRNGRRRGVVSVGTLSEMNVVPLVDVVLVLLIIFMLTANVMEFGLDIQVPTVKETSSSVEEHPVIGITRSGDLYLNGNPVKLALLGSEIRKRFSGQKAVYVRCDRRATYDVLANVVSRLGSDHFDVQLVTKSEDVTK